MSEPNRESWEEYKQQVLARLAEAQFAPVYGELTGAKPSGDGWMLACCPLHDDTNPSFGYSVATGQWLCFSRCGKGDAFEFLVRTTGKSFKEALVSLGESFGLSPPSSNGDGAGQVVYDYKDEGGTLLFQVVRGPGKKFWQRQPDGNGGWIKNLKGVRRVLYRLPELLARPSETVFVVEGEKDADRLHAAGLLATTNSGGAGKWKQSHSASLRGRNVVILPDNDAPGREHGQRVARSLHGVAASVKIVELPGLPEKGDVSDWLGAGHTADDLRALVDATAPEDPGREESPSGPLPTIIISDRQQRDVIAEAWRAIHALNDPPQLFLSAGQLARLTSVDGGLAIQHLDPTIAYGVLLRTADWAAERGGGIRDAKPPQEVARDIVANPDPELPPLDAVISTPTFDAEWRLLSTPGYHRDAKLWLHLHDDATAFEIPSRPTAEDLAEARSLLLDDLLVDFPFAADSDRAHCLAAFVLPFARRMFDGPTPIHLIEAPSPGSGKSLLADLISIVALGEVSGSTTLTRDEDESRKKITTLLSRGNPIIAIDNVDGGLWSSQIAAAITAEKWKDRLLGKTQEVTFPNRALWLISGNNPALSLENARRSIRIRITPTEERPWLRTGFKHDPIREWTKRHRPELVRAILVAIRSWITAGAPHMNQTLGSFEGWSRVVGGIVQHLGLHAFLGDADEFYAAADPESGEWGAFVAAWWEKYSSTVVGARELITLAEQNDLVAFAYAAKSEPAQRARFGRALSALRGRRFGELQVAVGENANRKIHAYRLVTAPKSLFSDKESF